MKSEVIAAAASSIQSAQSQSLTDGLGSVWDQAQAAMPPSGGFTQADIDAAVAAKASADAQILADAKSASDAALAASQDALAVMTSKDATAEQAIAAVKDSFSGLQAALVKYQDILAALAGSSPIVPSPTPSA